MKLAFILALFSSLNVLAIDTNTLNTAVASSKATNDTNQVSQFSVKGKYVQAAEREIVCPVAGQLFSEVHEYVGKAGKGYITIFRHIDDKGGVWYKIINTGPAQENYNNQDWKKSP